VQKGCRRELLSIQQELLHSLHSAEFPLQSCNSIHTLHLEVQCIRSMVRTISAVEFVRSRRCSSELLEGCADGNMERCSWPAPNPSTDCRTRPDKHGPVSFAMESRKNGQQGSTNDRQREGQGEGKKAAGERTIRRGNHTCRFVCPVHQVCSRSASGIIIRRSSSGIS
jgi:hypothetical protein